MNGKLSKRIRNAAYRMTIGAEPAQTAYKAVRTSRRSAGETIISTTPSRVLAGRLKAEYRVLPYHKRHLKGVPRHSHSEAIRRHHEMMAQYIAEHAQ